jgi:hypothetical protein
MNSIQYKKRRNKVTELKSVNKLPLKPVIRKILSYPEIRAHELRFKKEIP